MVDIARVPVLLTGSGLIGGGVMTLYSRSFGSTLSDALKAWVNTNKTLIPTDVIFAFPTSGLMIDDATGDVSGTWTGGAGGTVVGTAGGAYAWGVGAQVRWNTAGIVNNRAVRGRTFLVPLVGTVFTSDGGLDSTIAAGINASNATLITATSSNMCVWSRPAPGRAGSSHLVTSGVVSSVPSWLKSRKT